MTSHAFNDEIMDGDADIVDSVFAASRVFVAIASHALVGLRPEVTLPQFRALVLLDINGSMSMAELAEGLGVVPSTATRMCDRLVGKKLVSRKTNADNRRQVTVTLQPSGRRLIDESTKRRRREISTLLRVMSPEEQAGLAESLRGLVSAAAR